MERINCLEAFPKLFPAPEPPEIQYEHNMTFTVIRKSNVGVYSSYQTTYYESQILGTF